MLKKVMNRGSTHTSRCIENSRNYSKRSGKPYPGVVADEMERIYQSMYNARRALYILLSDPTLTKRQQQTIRLGLVIGDEQEPDRRNMPVRPDFITKDGVMYDFKTLKN